MPLTDKQLQNREEKVSNQALSLTERKQAYKEIMDSFLNPIKEKDFNPNTFEPFLDIPNGEIARRQRIDPPRRLPTKGLKPKEILDGQLIGMYESKQDLYLLIAWLSERVSNLEDQLNK